MTDRLRNKVILAMGRAHAGRDGATAKRPQCSYAREGARIFAVDISADAAAETRDFMAAEGGEARSFTVDATDSASVKAAVDACVAAHGRLDVLHNNVGAAEPGDPV